MIDCNFRDTDATWMAIQKQVARLQGLQKFPPGADAKRELCMALLTANSLDEAVFIIDRVVQSDATEYCPSPPDIRRMINAEHDRATDTATDITAEWKRQDSGYRCAECQDWGIAESLWAGDLNSVASYCDCAFGRDRRNLRGDKYSPEIVNMARHKLRLKFPDANLDKMISAAAQQKRLGTEK